ncbi:MAG: hypothetical protein EOO25_09105 [Comamonadaceae bacterium]|nr:MAG: hypothetical protein EOO25_09105 [Comamonadaceae bacterium]
MQHLLQRSAQFQDALVASFGSGVMLFDESPRRFASASACELSIEHAGVLRLAFGSGAPHSAIALLRLQYEALLRAAWLLHAASVEEVAWLTAPPDSAHVQQASDLPPAGLMLQQLAAKAQPGLVLPLQQFNTISLKVLHSHVHSGQHAPRRVASGFPEAQAREIVRNSNGLLHMAYRLIATLTGKKALVEGTVGVYQDFTDCLPAA